MGIGQGHTRLIFKDKTVQQLNRCVIPTVKGGDRKSAYLQGSRSIESENHKLSPLLGVSPLEFNSGCLFEGGGDL